MKEKKCPACWDLFTSSSSRCKKCHNEYMKQWYKNRSYSDQNKYKEQKRDYIRNIKSKPCTDCWNNFPWYVMDFDHLWDKSFNVSVSIQKWYSIKRIQKEIDKCDLVCANCHRIRTFTRE